MTSPVTHTAEVDVNKAFINDVPLPALVAAGSIKSHAPIKIMRMYPITIICVCVKFFVNIFIKCRPHYEPFKIDVLIVTHSLYILKCNNPYLSTILKIQEKGKGQKCQTMHDVKIDNRKKE